MDMLVELSQKLVRPYVTILFSSAAVAFVAMGMVDGDFFKTMVALVIGYYFGQREATKQVEQVIAAVATTAHAIKI